MLRVYGDLASGNCYKVRLLLRLLGREHEWSPVDILAGETRTADFLALNPNGKIPLLQEDDGFCLPESNAILCYLAENTAYLPAEGRERARVMQWLFFEQYSHEPNIATARYYKVYLQQHDHPSLPAKHAAGQHALAVMEAQLCRTPYIAGDRFSIADIALYAYTHVADEGGFSLAPYPSVRSWMERVTQQPGHIDMRPWLRSEGA